MSYRRFMRIIPPATLVWFLRAFAVLLLAGQQYFLPLRDHVEDHPHSLTMYVHANERCSLLNLSFSEPNSSRVHQPMHRGEQIPYHQEPCTARKTFMKTTHLKTRPARRETLYNMWCLATTITDHLDGDSGPSATPTHLHRYGASLVLFSSFHHLTRRFFKENDPCLCIPIRRP